MSILCPGLQLRARQKASVSGKLKHHAMDRGMWRQPPKLLATVLCAMLLSACENSADHHSSTTPQQEPFASERSANQAFTTSLAFSHSVSDLLVDDFDRDRRLDVALISHRANLGQVFYQRSSREFSAGPTVEAVGFHPGNLITLPDEGRGPRFLMSAEGEGRLRTLEMNATGGLDLVAETPVPFPRYSRIFHWPGWSTGVAVATFSTPSVLLLKGFDPIAGTIAPGGAQLPLKETVKPLTSLTIADVDGDAIDEVLFATPATGKLWQICYPGPDERPALQPLWEGRVFGAVRRIVAMDLNGDTRLDLIVPEEAGRSIAADFSIINILVSDGLGGFELVELKFSTREGKRRGFPGVRAADAGRDRDGRMYLLAAGYDALMLYQVSDNGPIKESPARKLPYGHRDSPSHVVLEDVDRDGWLDAVLARRALGHSAVVLFGPLWENFGSAASTKTLDSDVGT